MKLLAQGIIVSTEHYEKIMIGRKYVEYFYFNVLDSSDLNNISCNANVFPAMNLRIYILFTRVFNNSVK